MPLGGTDQIYNVDVRNALKEAKAIVIECDAAVKNEKSKLEKLGYSIISEKACELRKWEDGNGYTINGQFIFLK